MTTANYTEFSLLSRIEGSENMIVGMTIWTLTTALLTAFVIGSGIS
jgi:hypothetical protein